MPTKYCLLKSKNYNYPFSEKGKLAYLAIFGFSRGEFAVCDQK